MRRVVGKGGGRSLCMSIFMGEFFLSLLISSISVVVVITGYVSVVYSSYCLNPHLTMSRVFPIIQHFQQHITRAKLSYPPIKKYSETN